jgi:hypothetical protein
MSVHNHVGSAFDTGKNVRGSPWHLVNGTLETNSGDALVDVRAFEVYSYNGMDWTLLVVMNDYTMKLVQGRRNSNQPYAIHVLATPDKVPLEIKQTGNFILTCDLARCKINCGGGRVWFLSARDLNPALEWTFEQVSNVLFSWRAADNVRCNFDARMFALALCVLPDTVRLRVYGRVPFPLGGYHDALQIEVSTGQTARPDFMPFNEIRRYYFSVFCCIGRTPLPAEIRNIICTFMTPNKPLLRAFEYDFNYVDPLLVQRIPRALARVLAEMIDKAQQDVEPSANRQRCA